MANHLLTESILRNEVVMLASRWMPGRDFATLQSSVRLSMRQRMQDDVTDVLIEWDGARKVVEITRMDLARSLDDVSAMHLAPAMQLLANEHFPPPTNEDR